MELIGVDVLAAVGGDCEGGALSRYGEEIQVHKARGHSALQAKHPLIGIDARDSGPENHEAQVNEHLLLGGWPCCGGATASRAPAMPAPPRPCIESLAAAKDNASLVIF